jgi:Dolichyl-phosphate-mannose-protein mannosyltransferase
VTTTAINRPAAMPGARPRAGAVAIVAAVAGCVTLLVRLAMHRRSFDLFGDEVIYTDLGRSVISGGFPRFDGGAFFLHGPGFFYLEAGWARLAGNQPDLMGWVFEMRMLNALLAGATAIALVLLAARASSLRAGAAAGLLFSLEPFCIRQNDRVLLETAMMLWVMLGYLVFTSLIGRSPSRRDWPRAVAAGLLFGCAVLTKDEGALLTVLPLLAAAALRWGPRRALTLLTVGVTSAVYAAYVAVVAANGQIGGLWEAKTSGVQRMLGLIQTTGFHSSGGGDLAGRVMAEADFFGTTYVVLALAGPALVLLLRRGGQLPRMLGLLGCAAGVTLAYALVLGTLEEQELYLLVVPSLMSIPVAATLLHAGGRSRSRPAPRSGRRIPGTGTAVIAAVLTLALSLNLATCVRWLRQPDDGFAQLLQYMAKHVPAGARVDDDDSQYALAGRYQVVSWDTPAALSQDHVRYVVVEWALINDGYSDQTASQVRQLIGDDRLVFSFWGRTFGQIALYQLPLPPGPGPGVHEDEQEARPPRSQNRPVINNPPVTRHGRA